MIIRATFVMEQHLGHYSYYQNLRHNIENSCRVEANWIKVTYEQRGLLWSHLPGLPSRLRGSLTGRVQVLQGLRQRDHDVVVFNTQVPAVLGGKAAQKKPYVICTDITPRQYDRMAKEYLHPVDHNRLLNAFKDHANRVSLHGAAYLCPWSNWAAESLVNDYFIDNERIQVIPPGVDLEIWRPSYRPIENKPIRILFVGGDFYRKGGQALLNVYRSLPPGLAELILVTRTSLLPGKGIKIFNDVQPNSEQLISIYQSCDIFVLPSQAEAFGIAAVEASASGLPVIASAVGGLIDIVDDGKTGFLVPPGDENTLAISLRRLCEDIELRNKLGSNGRAQAEAQFDARKNADKLLNILEWITYEN